MSDQEKTPTPRTRTKAAPKEWAFYRTPLPVETSFSIPCASGSNWMPYGYDKDRRLIFRVDAEDVERFERHLFFKQGRLEKCNEPNL